MENDVLFSGNRPDPKAKLRSRTTEKRTAPDHFNDVADPIEVIIGSVCSQCSYTMGVNHLKIVDHARSELNLNMRDVCHSGRTSRSISSPV